MSATYPYRCILVVRADRAPAVNQWVKEHLNPTGGDWIQVNLSSTGAAPATHGWCNSALTESHAIKLAKLAPHLLIRGGIVFPAGWLLLSPAGKIKWGKDIKANLWKKMSAAIYPMNQSDRWTTPQEVLEDLNLKVIRPETAPASG